MRQVMYLLTCLFIALSCSKTNLAPEQQQAGIASSSNQSNSDHEVALPMIFNQPLSLKVFCGQTQVDVLSGQLNDQRCTMFGHFNPAYPGNYDMFIWQWMIHKFYGELASQTTGELFTMRLTRKVTPGDVSFHTNLLGNQGTHYVISGSFLRYSPFTMTIDKALCLENGGSE